MQRQQRVSHRSQHSAQRPSTRLRHSLRHVGHAIISPSVARHSRPSICRSAMSSAGIRCGDTAARPHELQQRRRRYGWLGDRRGSAVGHLTSVTGRGTKGMALTLSSGEVGLHQVHPRPRGALVEHGVVHVVWARKVSAHSAHRRSLGWAREGREGGPFCMSGAMGEA